MSYCKSCHKSIIWVTGPKGYIPLNPRTRDRHECDLDRVCEDCGAEFKGAAWMKKCRECFRSTRQTSAIPPEDPQRDLLSDDENDDKVPF